MLPLQFRRVIVSVDNVVANGRWASTLTKGGIEQLQLQLIFDVWQNGIQGLDLEIFGEVHGLVDISHIRPVQADMWADSNGATPLMSNGTRHPNG